MEWAGLTEWLDGLSWTGPGLLLRLVLAAILGGAVGLEREISEKPAGFRTNLLICVGAALLTDLSIAVSRAADPLQTQADPARIAAQIVSGIGFLGAGTIIQSRGSVVGLTTAATLWVVAAIGIAVGAGAYIDAVGATILVIGALILLGRLEERLTRRPVERVVEITLDPHAELLEQVRTTLTEHGFTMATLEVEKTVDEYILLIRASDRYRPVEELIRPLLRMSGVRKIAQI